MNFSRKVAKSCLRLRRIPASRREMNDAGELIRENLWTKISSTHNFDFPCRPFIQRYNVSRAVSVATLTNKIKTGTRS